MVYLKCGLLGEGTVQLVLSGKAFQALQALWQILLPELLSFAAESDSSYHDQLSANPERIAELIVCLKQERFHKLFTDFTIGVKLMM